MTTVDERLKELRESISEMSDDELHKIIGTSRNNREAPPAKPKAVKAKKKAGKKKNDPLALLSDLTEEQTAELLAKLTGKK